MTNLPPMQPIFGTASVPVPEGVLLVGIGAVFLANSKAEKQPWRHEPDPAQ